MLRAYILVGFTFFLIQMHISGNITKYINMKYAYLSQGAAVILAFLSVVQVIITFRKENHKHDQECCDVYCNCDEHNHAHGSNRGWKRINVNALFCVPIITGLLFPIATLNSSTVEAKGFHFPVADAGSKDSFIQRQYLKPDTSIYYGADGYRQLMDNEKKRYINQKQISLQDANFLKGMEVIYNFPGEFIGTSLSFKGFVFHDTSSNSNDYFLFRFGIIHCVADSGVYGMKINKPDDANWKNDDWIQVEGTIQTNYYQPFHSTIPVLEVTKWTKIDAPKDQYVYRGAD